MKNQLDEMETVLITGGSGLIGTRLSELLSEKGYSVRHLGRKPDGTEAYPTYQWSVRRHLIEPAALDGVDHIIHLAGAGIADKRWTPKRRREIINSRVESLKLLDHEISRLSIPLKTLVSASGINYYGIEHPDQIHIENDPPGHDFLSSVCIKWEEESQRFPVETRVVMLRTAMVLSKHGGALEKMTAPMKMFVGAPFGSGKQWMPWIHIDDLCRMYIHVLEHQISGPFNAVAPEYVTNNEFTRKLAAALKVPLWLPNIPGWVMSLLLGKMSMILLKGDRASSQKIMDTGFRFQFSELDKALLNLFPSSP